MRIFHVSEQAGIEIFTPRAPERGDLDKSAPLVWAVDELRLPNYLTPRDCPRVTFHAAGQTIESDIARFLSPPSRHCVAIEHGWLDTMRKTSLYLYEFDSTAFRLQDECAGYYVSEHAERPVTVTKIDDLFAALAARGVEMRLLGNLWPLADAVQKSTLGWSFIRMSNALARV